MVSPQTIDIHTLLRTDANDHPMREPNATASQTVRRNAFPRHTRRRPHQALRQYNSHTGGNRRFLSPFQQSLELSQSVKLVTLPRQEPVRVPIDATRPDDSFLKNSSFRQRAPAIRPKCATAFHSGSTCNHTRTDFALATPPSLAPGERPMDIAGALSDDHRTECTICARLLTRCHTSIT